MAADRFSTHDLKLGDDTVTKRYTSWGRGEPHREWAVLTLLAEHAPGIAPQPVQADLDANPPSIIMTRLPGGVLRGTVATGEQVGAVAATLNRLHREIPPHVVAAAEPAAWHPAAAVDKVRAWADKHPDLGDDPAVRRAFQRVASGWPPRSRTRSPSTRCRRSSGWWTETTPTTCGTATASGSGSSTGRTPVAATAPSRSAR
ncbi:phosphotransferase [Nonomuraea longicatena]|uniref:Aminoglycoside phosphotransferase domain-containing protein n=1 Tax=Nonomuraea longicatena TaxID=83682 RepID=A0ABN1R8Y9_9ACTN